MTTSEVSPSSSLRERTRRAVQGELLDVAQALFTEHGYESVTVDQIAAAAGLSRRSFFRYFGSKDALVLGKYDRLGEQFAESLAARPAGEPTWEALRRMFDSVVPYGSDPELARQAAEMDRVIQASDTLRAGFLERMQRAQYLVAEQLTQRGKYPLPDLDARATVAAAFAALPVAHSHAQASGSDFGASLDAVMAAIATQATGMNKS